jgi:hypothetical protein
VNLYVAEQQYAYARTLNKDAVVVLFNNDNNAAEFEFNVARAGVRDGAVMHDRLGIIRDVTVRDGHVRVNLPPRSVAILREQVTYE